MLAELHPPALWVCGIDVVVVNVLTVGTPGRIVRVIGVREPLRPGPGPEVIEHELLQAVGEGGKIPSIRRPSRAEQALRSWYGGGFAGRYVCNLNLNIGAVGGAAKGDLCAVGRP